MSRRNGTCQFYDWPFTKACAITQRASESHAVTCPSMLLSISSSSSSVEQIFSSCQIKQSASPVQKHDEKSNALPAETIYCRLALQAGSNHLACRLKKCTHAHTHTHTHTSMCKFCCIDLHSASNHAQSVTPSVLRAPGRPRHHSSGLASTKCQQSTTRKLLVFLLLCKSTMMSSTRVVHKTSNALRVMIQRGKATNATHYSISPCASYCHTRHCSLLLLATRYSAIADVSSSTVHSTRSSWAWCQRQRATWRGQVK